MEYDREMKQPRMLSVPMSSGRSTLLRGHHYTPNKVGSKANLKISSGAMALDLIARMTLLTRTGFCLERRHAELKEQRLQMI